MKSQPTTVQLIMEDSGEPIKFLMQNGGGKWSLFDCAPSNADSVQEFLKEALPNKEENHE